MHQRKIHDLRSHCDKFQISSESIYVKKKWMYIIIAYFPKGRLLVKREYRTIKYTGCLFWAGQRWYLENMNWTKPFSKNHFKNNFYPFKLYRRNCLILCEALISLICNPYFYTLSDLAMFLKAWKAKELQKVWKINKFVDYKNYN